MGSGVFAEGFCHLRAHSNYTLLTGSASPARIAERAAQLGLGHAALTDTNALYGVHAFSRACRKEGVVPVIGAHVVCGEESAVLLVRDAEGYGNLCRLITRRHLAKEFRLSSDLPLLSGGLTVLVNDPGLLQRLSGRLRRGQLFAEVVPGVRESDRVAIRAFSGPRPAGPEKCADRDPVTFAQMQSVLDAAEGLGLPAVITAGAYLSTAEEYPLHRLLTAIRKGCTVEQLRPTDLAHPDAWLQPPEALAASIPDTRRTRKAFRNAGRIASEISFALKPSPPRIPHPPLTQGETSDGRLRRIAFARAATRYGDARPETVDRLRKELAAIAAAGFSGYFLLVHEIVSFARARGIELAGRGSAAGSLVASLLGIARADPLEHDLSFERFLAPGRTGCPDIDLDICWKRRDEVIAHLFARFGDGRVAMISTHSTYRLRAAFRDAALTRGLPLERVDRLSRLLPRRLPGDPDVALATCPEMEGFPCDSSGAAEALRDAAAILGFPRHLSVHTGGIVIGRDRLDGIVPLERAAGGTIVTQYDGKPVEELGLVKIDLLGQRGLTAVAEARGNLRRRRGVAIRRSAIPAQDGRTAELTGAGRTIGCFQIESPALRGLLARMGARSREDLITAIALVRPGPSTSGMKETYLRRRLGLEKGETCAPRLAQILPRTFGVMLYQEDVLRVARELGGFGAGEADRLRRAMTKEREGGLMSRLRERFLAGAGRRGLRRATAEEIFDAMRGFASYSFCKAHAVTFGLVAWEAAFLKARFPAELLAAVIANEGGFYTAGVYIEEARRLGVRIRPPCVNASAAACRAESGGVRGAIRPGLAQVRGLTENGLASILAARRAGPFRSLGDCLRRTGLGTGGAEALVLSGAFDFTGVNRPALLWQVKGAAGTGRTGPRGGVRHGAARPGAGRCIEGRRGPGETPGLFDERGTIGTFPPPSVPDYEPARKLELEHACLGFSPTAHPISLFASLATRLGAARCADLPARAGRTVRIVAWVISSRRARTPAGGLMKFLTFEDATGTIEATLFPAAYRRLGAVAVETGPFLVEGRVESRRGFPALDVTEIRRLSDL